MINYDPEMYEYDWEPDWNEVHRDSTVMVCGYNADAEPSWDDEIEWSAILSYNQFGWFTFVAADGQVGVANLPDTELNRALYGSPYATKKGARRCQ
jgi:hypothetical protein